MDFTQLKAINDKNEADIKQQQSLVKQDLANIDLQGTIVTVVKTLVEFLQGHTTRAVVVNQLKEIATPDALKVAQAVDEMHETLKTHENTDIAPLVEVMNRVLKEAEKIPKTHKDIKIPEPIDFSSQFNSLEDAVRLATEAIKAQETTVEAPVVNVEAPKVEVQAPDLKAQTKELGKLFEQAVKGIKIPAVPKTDLTKLEKEQKETTKAIKSVNKTLQEMPTGGGGGGGNTTPYQDDTGKPVYLTLEGGSIPEPTLAVIIDDTTTADTTYICKAPIGTATSSASWQIAKLNTSSGLVKTWADGDASFDNVADNRASLSYS